MSGYADAQRRLRERLGWLAWEIDGIEASARAPHAADGEEQATERELESADEPRERQLLREAREVRAALERIAVGTYGLCSGCGAPIDPRRLEAEPEALRCVPCASSVDANKPVIE